MTASAVVVFVLLAILGIGQGILVLGFARLLRQQPPRLLSDDDCPKAAVILCLRGCDPFLKDCLQALLVLDYPSYVIHIIVDHTDDPAWQIVRSMPVSSAMVHHTLTERGEACSLKCSSLVQVVKSLDDSYQFVAQLDADTIPHETWLRELATALNDQHVGAVTGNRWYMPPDARWGSLARYFWNSAAIVQMASYRIAWGGTLAIKMRTIEDAGLIEHWSRAFCEDTMLSQMLRSTNWRLKFVPSLLMVNRESSGLSEFRRWLVRQLLTARLYHPNWWLVLFHGLSTSLLMLLGAGLFLLALTLRHSPAAWWAATAVGGFQLMNYVWLFMLERAARHAIGNRGENVQWISMRQLLRMPLAVLLTQIVYFLALCTAVTLRTVKWRQIEYSIGGPWRIRMRQYLPWRGQDKNPNQTLL